MDLKSSRISECRISGSQESRISGSQGLRVTGLVGQGHVALALFGGAHVDRSNTGLGRGLPPLETESCQVHHTLAMPPGSATLGTPVSTMLHATATGTAVSGLEVCYGL